MLPHDPVQIALLTVLVVLVLVRIRPSKIRAVLSEFRAILRSISESTKARFTIRDLLLATTVVAGAWTGFELIAQVGGHPDHLLAVIFGVPVGGFAGNFIGRGILKIGDAAFHDRKHP